MSRLCARVDVLKHRVGTCPACREYLWAQVTVESFVSDPTLTDEGHGSVHASAECVAMRLLHECAREAS